MKKILLSITLFFLIGFQYLIAQTAPNLTFYGARSVGQSSLLNPALPSRQAFTLGLFDLYQNAYVPGITANDIFNPKDSSAGQTIYNIINSNSINFNNISSATEINPLFIGFKIKRNYFSLGATVRIATDMSIPKDMFSLFYYGNAGQLFGKKINIGVTDFSTTSYASMHVGYSREVNEKLTIGIRGKYILGLYDVRMIRSNFTLQTDSGTNNALKINATSDYQLNGAGLDRISDFSNSTATPGSSDYVNRYLTPYYKDPVGKGFGLDLGMNYKVTRRFSVSASVLDLGSINWKIAKSYSNNASFNFEGVVENNPDSFQSAFEHLVDSVKTIFEPTQQDITYKTKLPTSIYIGTNYQLYNSGALGTVFYGSFNNGKLIPGASVSYSQRIWRILDLRVNYNIYQKQYSNVGAGFAVHVGPLVVYAASDNILGYVNWDKAHWTNTRVGLNINIGGRFDSDNDGVPNKKDQCKKIPGLVKFNGCPDSDGDSVPDPKDLCPKVKGTVLAKGCPDIDGDGVSDLSDSCVNEKGSAALFGCPDRDNDGIADKYDECPNDSGSVSRNGCPDRDGDGVLDKNDDCPDIFGSKITKGCPDLDNDSVPDRMDDCPSIPGPISLRGCPDFDGDGIINKLDSCVAEAGPARTFGCPDTDGDGIADKYDNCPTEAGVAENNGCPTLDPSLVILNEEEKKVLNEAFSNLEFQTGTAKISESSLASLAELAELLKVKTEYKLEISGHTDNVGNAAKNQKLSQDRANAVKTFLTGKGVGATRLKAQGFGSKKPISENTTAEGRQRNRRVEFKIVK